MKSSVYLKHVFHVNGESTHVKIDAQITRCSIPESRETERYLKPLSPYIFSILHLPFMAEIISASKDGHRVLTPALLSEFFFPLV